MAYPFGAKFFLRGCMEQASFNRAVKEWMDGAGKVLEKALFILCLFSFIN